jgi:hypothetical protein
LCENVLEPLRLALGKSVKVNSGYRGPALNQRLRGTTKSQHLAGQAADIQCPGMPVVEVFKTAIRLGLPFDQIIYEANRGSRWVHVSHRPGANRGEIRVAKFGPDGRPLSYPTVSLPEAMALTERVTRSSRGVEPGYIEGADEPFHGDDPQPAADAAVPARRTRSKAATTAAATVAGRRAVVDQAAASKPAPGDAAATKVPAKKAVAKTAPSKQTASKKAPAKKAPVKKSSAKKAVAKPVSAKRKSAKVAAAQKPAARSPAAVAVPPKRTPSQKARAGKSLASGTRAARRQP